MEKECELSKNKCCSIINNKFLCLWNLQIILKAHSNTWIEVIVRYLVEPKNSGQVKKKLFDAVMEELKKHPELVMFPKTNMR